MALITPSVAERIKKGRAYPETVRALAEKWGPLFKVDPSWVMEHCYVESTNVPSAFNPGGKAYGLMQLKLPTATDIVRWIKANGVAKNEDVRAVLKSSWRGQGEDLWNPELNVMLGTFYLGYIRKKLEEKFGSEIADDHNVVAAAYNQGPGAVRKALRSGEFKPTDEMKKYIAKIENAKEEGYA